MKDKEIVVFMNAGAVPCQPHVTILLSVFKFVWDDFFFYRLA